MSDKKQNESKEVILFLVKSERETEKQTKELKNHQNEALNRNHNRKLNPVNVKATKTNKKNEK